jgi:hypothetical protein
MKNVGTVLNIIQEGSNVHLEGGTSQQQFIFHVRLDDGRMVYIRREDALKAD